MLRGSYFWKEVGCRAKPATSRKALKSIGSTTAQDGTRSEVRFQKPPENEKKKPKLLREKLQRGIVEYPLSESQWNRGHFRMEKWESEKHKSWCMAAEGFKGHVATDGSLLDTAGKR